MDIVSKTTLVNHPKGSLSVQTFEQQEIDSLLDYVYNDTGTESFDPVEELDYLDNIGIELMESRDYV